MMEYKVFVSVGTAMLCAMLPTATNAGVGITGSELQLKCAAVEVALANPDAPADNKVMRNLYWCVGYVQGEIEGTRVTALLDNKKRYPYCPSESTTPLQDAQVVIKYLHDHPEHLDWPAGLLIKGALETAYPCPPRK